MKKIQYLSIFIVLLCSSFKNIYLSKKELQQQYQSNTFKSAILCLDKDSNKVWIGNYSYNYAIVHLNNSKKKRSIHLGEKFRIENDTLKGMVYQDPPMIPQKANVAMSDIDFIEIITATKPIPYYNLDSAQQAVVFKNDSISKAFMATGHNKWILVSKQHPSDSIMIFEQACYDLEFADGTKTQKGVVRKLTTDSIYISSAFNPEAAAFERQVYSELAYHKKDLAIISILKKGGWDTKKLDAVTYDLYPETDNSNSPSHFYKLHGETGTIRLYRYWFTQVGFVKIFEEGGKIYW
ncbi:hypothetical protein [Taibaiella sp. KBW10]|uniref:hypothetical protein n=1 Tax=Taibaiella sp. KBW10 TaxID=2153357 RepID=UPI000F59C839|nr:hypothetical protein [Taibaiella sp. KBW10]